MVLPLWQIAVLGVVALQLQVVHHLNLEEVVDPESFWCDMHACTALQGNTTAPGHVSRVPLGK